MIQLSTETGLKASVGVFLLSCIFLTTSYTTTFAFDHPLNSLVLSCYLSGTSLLVLSRFIHFIPNLRSPHKYKNSSIPLTESGDQLPIEVSSPVSLNGFSNTKTRNRALWIKVALLSAIGCIRVELYRQINLNVECAPARYAYAIPFLVSIYDYWRDQRFRPAQAWFPTEDGPSNTQIRKLVTLFKRISFHICQSRARYIIPATFLLAGGFLATAFHEGTQSTYICPITSGKYSHLQYVSIFSTVLDFLVLVGAAELSREGLRPREGKRKQTLVAWGCGLLVVAVLWSLIGIILWNGAKNRDRGFVGAQYLQSTFIQSLLVTLALISASQIIPYYGLAGLSILAGFIANYFSWVSAMFNGQEPFPLIFSSQAFITLLTTFVGVMLFLYSRTECEEEPPFLYRFNIFLRLVFSILFCIGVILVTQQPDVANLHPIDLLIYEGRLRHDAWFSKAKASSNLAEAVTNYRMRYNQYPPPGFDKWYEYAVSRSSVVIDDFDQIYNDLLPFRALSPERIRQLTHELATNPFNNIGAISIRNGTPRIQEGILPTHAWMVLGAAKIIENFSEHLPDMDLVFNLNDEPRVAVPWEKMSSLKEDARSQTPPPKESILNRWSMDRDTQWGPIVPADMTTTTMFTEASFKNIFNRYVSPLCPPSSKARSQRIWDRRHLCLSCVRPHSMGQFPSDTSLSTDICHQPDLASLHGFFLSPASFKVTQELVPVFSQGTVSGFNDILFPSPWNYVDKIKYDPSDDHPDPGYEEKDNKLFWIGSTSEGLSHTGEWKGMPRQRFAHLINNNTLNQVSVLLPVNGTESYSYQVLDGTAPSEILGLQAAALVTDVVRCWGADCDDEKKELGTSSFVDFQSHWQNRYLFDLDGAGFSGRFLPFLQSHSLPFKTGLFRQWFDSRVTAWLHYVPIDIRLHGVWSTLAYFAGVNVPVGVDSNGQAKMMMEPHNIQGQWIAKEGRKWAHQALRKEDMEIYFFRLLLEWGRLTDDQRDSIGYAL